MAKRDSKPIEMKTIADHVEESPEVSDLVDRLESEADQEIAARKVTPRRGSAKRPERPTPETW